MVVNLKKIFTFLVLGLVALLTACNNNTELHLVEKDVLATDIIEFVLPTETDIEPSEEIQTVIAYVGNYEYEPVTVNVPTVEDEENVVADVSVTTNNNSSNNTINNTQNNQPNLSNQTDVNQSNNTQPPTPTVPPGRDSQGNACEWDELESVQISVWGWYTIPVEYCEENGWTMETGTSAEMSWEAWQNFRANNHVLQYFITWGTRCLN